MSAMINAPLSITHRDFFEPDRVNYPLNALRLKSAVVLLADHPELGSKGDLVLAKQGRARKTLIPQKQARNATPFDIVNSHFGKFFKKETLDALQTPKFNLLSFYQEFAKVQEDFEAALQERLLTGPLVYNQLACEKLGRFPISFNIPSEYLSGSIGPYVQEGQIAITRDAVLEYICQVYNFDMEPSALAVDFETIRDYGSYACRISIDNVNEITVPILVNDASFVPYKDYYEIQVAIEEEAARVHRERLREEINQMLSVS